MLDVLVGCDEDITKFLRAKCVLSAAKLTNEIITEDRTVQPQSTNAGLLRASWRAKTATQRTDCVETSRTLLQGRQAEVTESYKRTLASFSRCNQGNDFTGYR
jgi:hypothetical protein